MIFLYNTAYFHYFNLALKKKQKPCLTGRQACPPAGMAKK